MSKQAAYSQVMGCKDIVTTSGQIALNEKGELIGADDIKAQTIQTLKNAQRYISEVGMDITQISSLTVFLQDIERDFYAFDEAFREFFGSCKPARAAVQAKLLKPEWLIEVQVIANRNVNNTEK